jgi:hypothetical protein
VVVLGHGVGLESRALAVFLVAFALEVTHHSTQNCSRQPSQGLFHDAPDVWQPVEVFHLWKTAAADLFELGLGLLLYFWVEHHGLNKSVQSSCGRVRASLQAVAYTRLALGDQETYKLDSLTD